MGFSLGILVDVFFLKRWVSSAHQLDIRLWMIIFLFYSVVFFGFFMGVPVFNVILSLPAGYIIGGRLVERRANSEQVRQGSQRTAWFTTITLLFVCSASAAIALVSPSTSADLKGILGFGFEITQTMLVSLIFIGGMLLLVANWVLAVFAVRFSFTLLDKQMQG